MAGRRQVVSAARSVQPTDQAVLVSHSLRRWYARTDPERSEDRRPLLAHGPAQEPGWLGGHLLRTEGAGRLRKQLDSDRPGQKLVRVFPVLPADRSLLRSVLAATGLRASIERARASPPKSCD